MHWVNFSTRRKQRIFSMNSSLICLKIHYKMNTVRLKTQNLTSNYHSINSMYLSTVDSEEILNIIKKLKNSNSVGTDDINTKIAK